MSPMYQSACSKTRCRTPIISVLAVGLMVAAAQPVAAQTSPALNPGDIAIISWIDNGSPDSWAFVTLGPIPATTVIYFTDNGWTGTAFRNTVADGDGNEGMVKWTATNTIVPGRIIRTTDSSADFSWTTSGLVPGAASGSFAPLALNVSGDQIYAFQGPATLPLASPSVHLSVLDDTNGFENATDTATGSVPPGLTAGTNAFTFAFTSSSFISFNTNTLSSGTKAQWLAAIAGSGNWTTAASGTLPSGNICVTANLGLTVAATDPTICPSASTTITVAASELTVSYQLHIGGSPVGSAQTGTGGTLSFGSGNVASTTVFNVKATSSSCSAVQLTQTATVTIPNCDDSNPCTDDSCNAGVCSNVNNSSVCADDGNPCTLDVCNGGSCMHVVQDADGDGVCDANDTCANTPNGEAVNAQGCSCSQIPPCDDGNPCTTDSCNAGVCTFVNNTNPCTDDGDPCTLDVCSGGGCSHIVQDADGDGVCDANDTCPNTPMGEAPNAQGCSCSQVNCNDGNPCTLDTCANGVCSNTFQDADGDGVCDANDTCPNTPMGETPNAQGCSCSQVNCNDGNPCTLDTCANGVCSNSFQDADGDGVCDANDTCPGTPMGEGVNAQGCSCSQVNCDDNDPCTLDSCLNGVCSHAFQDADGDGVCNANDACPGTPMGEGVNGQGCSCSQVNCDDNDPCTLDSCLNGVCSHTFQDADGDGVCDANDTCPNTPMGETPNAQGCSCSQVNCDDNNACTTDGCTNGICSHTPVNCDDNDASTIDSCDSVLGCQHAPIDCDDEDACTVDSPDMINGCNHTPVNCDDMDPCTTDGCDPETGCTHTLIDADDDGVCDLNDACPNTPMGETPNAQGCSCSQVNCDDNDACTLDTCLNGICSHIFQDADADGVCDANDTCPNTPMGETPNGQGCSCSQVNCDDNDSCTLDGCSNGTCSHTFQDADGDGICDANDTCANTPMGETPNAQGCSCSQVNCSDGNPCTLDTCLNGICSHTFQDADSDGICDANDTCPGTPMGETPNGQGCSCSQVNCDDGNPCTLDTCMNGICSHTFQDADGDGICDANDACPDTPMGETPNAQGCSCSQITSCDDGNPCTTDSCIAGVCIHTPIPTCAQLSLNVLGSGMVCSGSSLDVAVNVSSLSQAVNGAQVLLQYDPTILSLTSATPGSGAGSPWDVALPVGLVDNAGAVTYALVIVGGGGTTANARVATFHFNVLPPVMNIAPTSVNFRPDQGPIQTKLTLSSGTGSILPLKSNSGPITVGPQIAVALHVQGLTHAVTRDVTFELTDCATPGSPQTIVLPVALNASGVGSVILTGINTSADYLAVREGHTLRRRVSLSWSSCFATASLTGANELIAGDLQAPNAPQDNLVDILDFSILASRFGTQVSECGVGLPQNCSLGADINGDSIQDTGDFSAIQINFYTQGDDAHSCPPTLWVKGAILDTHDEAPVLPTRKSRAWIRVSELPTSIIVPSKVDLNADGLVDYKDIRAFARARGLPLLPQFEAKLNLLESATSDSGR